MKRSPALSGIAALLLTACSLAPEYKVPEAPTPPAFKEAAGWVEAQPADSIDRDGWWKVYGDARLNALEDQVTAANQSLKLAVAQYDQARAAAGAASAAIFPTINLDAGAARQQTSRTVANKAGMPLYNNFTMGADLSYEIDLWGRVRNSIAANQDQAEASAADLSAVALSLHAELARDYFTLCGDDETIAVLDKTVAADQQAFDLTKRRYEGGVVAETDVDQAENQLENAKTQDTDLRLQRAQMEHALAILTGQAPADFNLPAQMPVVHVPNMQVAMPSVLLQRRPDIAAAERRTAAANAEIGVARAAWFPDFNLAAMIGLQSGSAAHWLTAPSQFWSLGPSMALPLVDGGLISALNAEARAAYEQAVAAYRQTVLTAYGEVEDNLVALRRLDDESRTQAKATQAAERNLAQANNLYKQGATTYLDVVVAQNTELQAQVASVTVKTRRLNASVQLIEALGGGWQAPAQP